MTNGGAVADIFSKESINLGYREIRQDMKYTRGRSDLASSDLRIEDKLVRSLRLRRAFQAHGTCGLTPFRIGLP